MSQTKAQLLDGKSATIQFTGGSASVPSVSFTGDTNTGIYSPGADQVAISTGGSPRVTVTSTGVGIGTTSPNQLLHVASALTTGGATPVTWSRSGGATGYLLVDGSGAGIYSGGAFSDSGIYLVPNDRVSFSVNGSERFRCDSSGRLLVGTSSTSATLTALLQGNSASATSNASLQIARGEIPAATGTVLGALDFSASNHVLASRILCKSDGAWTAGTSQPTRLEFFTTADGESSPTERMRISNNGQITHSLNGTTNAANLTLSVGGVGDPGNSGWITPRIDFVGSNLASSGTTFIGATGALGGRSLVFATGSDATGSERARIDSSGRLLVGTSSSASVSNSQYAKLQVHGNTFASTNQWGAFTLARTTSATSIVTNDPIGGILFTDVSGNEFATIITRADGNAGSGDYPGRIEFSTTADGASSPTERMRIGNTGSFFALTGSGNGFEVASEYGAGTGQFVFVGRYGATSATSTGTSCIQIFTNGNVQNTNNSYTAISDIKLKENIVDAGSQWADLKALRVRNYNLKEGQTHRQIGLIAQEVEPISPGLVYETPDRDNEGNDLGTVTKSVNYSVLYMKAVKALQEAMERIEQLESEMVAVKTQLS